MVYQVTEIASFSLCILSCWLIQLVTGTVFTIFPFPVDAFAEDNCLIEIVIFDETEVSSTLVGEFSQASYLSLTLLKISSHRISKTEYERLNKLILDGSWRSSCFHIIILPSDEITFGLYSVVNFNWNSLDGNVWFHIVSNRGIYYTNFKEMHFKYVDDLFFGVDSRISFFILDNTGVTVAIPCQHCETERMMRVSKIADTEQTSLDSLRHWVDETKGDLQGAHVPVTDTSYSEFGPIFTACKGLSIGNFEQECDSRPQRVITRILSQKLNFTVRVYTSGYMLYNRQWTGVFAGVFHRCDTIGTKAKQYFSNIGKAHLIYCENHVDTESVSWFSMLHPMYMEVRVVIVLDIAFLTAVLLVATREMARQAKPNGLQWALLLLPAPFFRQPIPTIPKSLNFAALFLLFLWCCTMSTTLSANYEAVMTSQLVVPLKDKSIQTFKELVLCGFKLVWPGGEGVNLAMATHFRWKFKDKDIRSYNETVIISTLHDTEEAQLRHLVETAGNTTRLYAAIEIEYILRNLNLVMARNHTRFKGTKCFAQTEIFEMKEDTWYFKNYMANSYMKIMSDIAQSGIGVELNQNYWETKLRRTKKEYFSVALYSPKMQLLNFKIGFWLFSGHVASYLQPLELFW